MAVSRCTSAEDFADVCDKMAAAGQKPESAQIEQRATTTAPLAGDDAEKLLRLLDMLEDLDDVQEVFSNADFPDELLQQQAG